MKKGLSICLVFIFSFFLCKTSFSQKGITFRIDYIDESEFLTKNQLKFYIDVLDEDYAVIPKLSSTDIKIYIRDVPKEILGTTYIQQFSELYEPVAVVVLFASHREFTIPASTGEGVGYVPLELIKQGVINFSKKLGENDKMAIFTYDEKGKDSIFPFGAVKTDRITQNLEMVRAKLELEESQKGIIISPPFYKYLKDIVYIIGEEQNLPRRKILLVVSDGLDSQIENSSYINKIIDEISQNANYARIKIYAVGFTPSDRRKLINLQSLSEKTGGIYRSPQTVSEIPSIIENIADEIKKQYVVTFVSDEIDGGKPTTFRMEVFVQGSTKGAQYEEIILPKKPFPWLKTIIIVISSIVGLIILILFARALSGYLAERRRRREEERVLLAKEEEYTGPFKGKLSITTGPLAGKIFYITQNVTNIGALEDNQIVIVDGSVSKKHASIRIEDLKYEISDLGSTNGVYVNGRKVLKQYLKDGDEIKLGTTTMAFTLK